MQVFRDNGICKIMRSVNKFPGVELRGEAQFDAENGLISNLFSSVDNYGIVTNANGMFNNAENFDVQVKYIPGEGYGIPTNYLLGASDIGMTPQAEKGGFSVYTLGGNVRFYRNSYEFSADISDTGGLVFDDGVISYSEPGRAWANYQIPANIDYSLILKAHIPNEDDINDSYIVQIWEETYQHMVGAHLDYSGHLKLVNESTSPIGGTVLSLDSDYWIKIEKISDTWSLYYSTDGEIFNLSESFSLAMGDATSRVYFGCDGVDSMLSNFPGTIDLRETYIESSSHTILWSATTEEWVSEYDQLETISGSFTDIDQPFYINIRYASKKYTVTLTSEDETTVLRVEINGKNFDNFTANDFFDLCSKSVVNSNRRPLKIDLTESYIMVNHQYKWGPYNGVSLKGIDDTGVVRKYIPQPVYSTREIIKSGGSSGSFTLAMAQEVEIEIVGGGGGIARSWWGGQAGWPISGAGGSGSAYAGRLFLNAGTYSYSVGKGGTNFGKYGTYVNGAAGNGGATTISSSGTTIISAGGGAGGKVYAGHTTNWAYGGAGGTLNTTNASTGNYSVKSNGKSGGTKSGGDATGGASVYRGYGAGNGGSGYLRIIYMVEST